MKYVIGVDLGTSAVKVLLVNSEGEVTAEASEAYPLHQPRSGYNEQDPEDWVRGTLAALSRVVKESGVDPQAIEGISFSGQMHGLVLLDENHRPLRNAILWNDTRTTEECRKIEQVLGEDLLRITKNPALEGFTLPKILWVKEHEPEVFAKAKVFLLPKDYLRYRLTGQIHMDYSDAAGTLLLDVANKKWSSRVLEAFGLEASFCPPLVESHGYVGNLLPEAARETGLSESTRIFAGGADNACGAIGSGILQKGLTMASIGTSGVVLSYEDNKDQDFGGKVHFFNHGKQDAFYAMGVTLGAGYSMSWFKNTFAKDKSYDELLGRVSEVPVGSNGLLFTPYLVGERTPHADAMIRASFIGLDGSHTLDDMARAVMEGITFSLNESIELFRQAGIQVNRIVAIGGGAKNEDWLHMQADIFNAEIVQLANEQGPGMGAAMLAALGCGWFDSLEACAAKFIRYEKTYKPNPERVEQYKKLFEIYKQVYTNTKSLSEQLAPFRP